MTNERTVLLPLEEGQEIAAGKVQAEKKEPPLSSSWPCRPRRGGSMVVVLVGFALVGSVVILILLVAGVIPFQPLWMTRDLPFESSAAAILSSSTKNQPLQLPSDWKRQLSEVVGSTNVLVSNKNDDDTGSLENFTAVVWNQIVQKQSLAKAVLLISDEEQLPPLLTWLHHHKQPFAIKSGGHNKAGYSYSPNGFVIDLSGLSRLKELVVSNINDNNNPASSKEVVVKIQPGMHGLELVRHTLGSSRSGYNNDGYGAVVGICPTVALGGFILNGGYGWLSRQHGLGSDNLVNVRIVTVDVGRANDDDDDDDDDDEPLSFSIVDVNRHHQPDLFWALQGAGGGSFGIVTEMTYKIHPGYQDGNFNGMLLVELSDVPRFLVGLADMDRAGTLPRAFTMIVELYSMTGMQSSNNDTTTSSNKTGANPFQPFLDLAAGMKSPVAFACAWVSVAEDLELGKTFLQDTLPSLAGPTALMAMEEFPWTKNGVTGGDFPPSPPYYVESFSGYVTDPTLETMTNIVNLLHSWSEEWYPIIEPDTELWGGAISDVPANATAFPHRDAIFNIAAIVYVPVDRDGAWETFQRAVDFLKERFHLLHLHNGTYSNYQQRSLTPDEYPRAYFGDNLERLVQIKQKYDPQNVFDYPQGIPLDKK